jgi:hypothetical protein
MEQLRKLIVMLENRKTCGQTEFPAPASWQEFLEEVEAFTRVPSARVARTYDFSYKSMINKNDSTIGNHS